MTDHKFTEDEIVKALECCSKDVPIQNSCEGCPFAGKKCAAFLPQTALDLIKRQKAKIERLTMKLTSRTDENTILRRYFGIKTDEQVSRIIANYKGVIQTTKSEAIKEFAERLRKITTSLHPCSDELRIFDSDIDTLVKEMTEGNK